MELGTEPFSLHAYSKKFRYPDNFKKNDHSEDCLSAREENAELPPHEGAKNHHLSCKGTQSSGSLAAGSPEGALMVAM